MDGRVDWQSLRLDRALDGADEQVGSVVQAHQIGNAFSRFDGHGVITGLPCMMQADESLRLHIGQSAQHAIAAADSVDGVVFVESGQHAERWIHLTNGSDDLPGVADGVDGVFDADDVLVLRCEIRHQLGCEVVARPGWEVVQNDRQRRCLGHRREVALRAIRGWSEIVRGYCNQCIGSGYFAFRRQCSHIV